MSQKAISRKSITVDVIERKRIYFRLGQIVVDQESHRNVRIEAMGKSWASVHPVRVWGSIICIDSREKPYFAYYEQLRPVDEVNYK